MTQVIAAGQVLSLQEIDRLNSLNRATLLELQQKGSLEFIKGKRAQLDELRSRLDSIGNVLDSLSELPHLSVEVFARAFDTIDDLTDQTLSNEVLVGMTEAEFNEAFGLIDAINRKYFTIAENHGFM